MAGILAVAAGAGAEAGAEAEAKDWICRALVVRAGERMTPIKAKNHPWLASLR